MPWIVPLEDAEQAQGAGQFVAKTASLIMSINAVVVLVLHGQAMSGALAMSTRSGRSSALMEL